MLLTTILFTVLLVGRGEAAWKIVLFAVVFLTIEGAFLGANLVKLGHGGWIPIVLAAGIYSLMATWKQGQRILVAALRRTWADLAKPIEEHIRDARTNQPTRIDHPAVYLDRFRDLVPPALYLNWMHNRALHNPILILTVETADVPRVPEKERRSVEALGEGAFRILLRWGFMEEPDVPAGLRGLVLDGKELDPLAVSYILGRDALIATDRPSGMARWRERLFSWMRRNEARAAAYYRIPPSRAIEFGIQVEI
jgi:KUP system potassium uptake protein